jgi:hypothetical protein
MLSRYTAIMAAGKPSAVIVERDPERRARLAAVLRDTGFAVVANSPDPDLDDTGHPWELAVVGGEPEPARRLRDRHPGIKLLLVQSGTDMDAADTTGIALVAGAFDERRVRAAALALMAPDATEAAGKRTAELGIVAAQLACLFARRRAAEDRGATRLARDIDFQIGDAMAARRSLLRSRHGAGAAAPNP